MSKTKKTVTVVIICLALLAGLIAIFSTTQAIYTNTDISPREEYFTTGNLQIKVSSKSQDISLSDTLPMYDSEGLTTEPYIFTIQNIGNVAYSFDVEILSTTESYDTIGYNYIRMQVNDSNPVTLSELPSGSSGRKLNGNSKYTLTAGQEMTIKLRVWLKKGEDASSSTPNTEIGKSFSSRIIITGQAVSSKENAIDYISRLYASSEKITVTHNDIEYSYAPDVRLMMDRFGGISDYPDQGNIRYYGADDPDDSDDLKNYIYFNCTDYSDTDTCELWRIIGIVDGKVKIIRNESIGDYSWDSSVSTVNSGYGINQWGPSGSYQGADLMKLLNPGYDDNTIDGTNTLVNNSLYWERANGKCFNGPNNSSADCDFTTSGITTATKDNNLIVDATWYLGAIDTNNIYANEAYTSERGTNVVVPGTTCSDTYCNDTITRTTSWTGKGALMYLSDYGYAADLTKCGMLSAYNSSNNSYECRNNDWLYYSSNWQKTINAHLANANSVWIVNRDGGAHYDSAPLRDAVRPVYYLNPSSVIDSGDGSQDNPFALMVQ